MGNNTTLPKRLNEIVSTLDSVLNNSTIQNPPDDCSSSEETPYLNVRYHLIGVAGFLICAVGIMFNIILLKILLQSSLRSTYLLYLSALAIIDINISVTYIAVMSVATWYEYYSNHLLYHIWHLSLPYFYTVSRVATLASSYLIVACTVERYLEVMQLYKNRTFVRITHQKRYVVVACVILASIAFRVVVFWEIDILTNKECKGTFNYYILDRTWLINDFYYSKIYSFYALHLIQIFLPFAILFILNFLIVRKWRIVLRRDTIQHQSVIVNQNLLLARLNSDPTSLRGSLQVDATLLDKDDPYYDVGARRKSEREEMRKRVKCAQSARCMMIAIVTSYLLCNLLNVVLTFLEHLAIDMLRAHGDFYSFASDTVTLLTVVNAMVRLPIYYITNLKIRTETNRILRDCAQRAKYEYAENRGKRPSILLWVQQKKRNQQIMHMDSNGGFGSPDEPEEEAGGFDRDGSSRGSPSEVTPLCEEAGTQCPEKSKEAMV